ncbi:MAG: glutamine-hydrolyzing carbamoyl-phosphate synthase small subunit [Pseudomonadales bacterium]|nr:glutamine-hydrolyzing carbamoyl-phosphate synthase small subunit [Pseudomonadales bacterium]
MDTALLALEDGSVFRGSSVGAPGTAVGEIVFNTAMTGYQEILSDPSYAKQLVTLTYPHIGNTGCNAEDMESDRVWASGLVIRDLPLVSSSWRAEQTLGNFLKQQNVVAIAEIDTRRLTRIIREKGALSGCILSAAQVSGGQGPATDKFAELESEALRQAHDFPGLLGMDLAKMVSCTSPYEWNEGEWQLDGGFQTPPKAEYHVVAYDFGVKRNILRMLSSRGCKLTVVPAQTTAEDVLALKPDGVFLSNGPGDPEPCVYAISAIKTLLERRVPMFGICLGHQLLALASGAKSMKMPHGHHGANHPVKDLETGNVIITSQNHGFATDASSLPDCLTVTHVSLFDNTLQGVCRNDAPAFSFQGHPEASPGPQDCAYLFDRFISMMESARGLQDKGPLEQRDA